MDDRVIATRRYEYQDKARNANKFWMVKVVGSKVLLHWGRRGTNGQQKILVFRTFEDAKADANNRVMEKLGKGYRAVPIPENLARDDVPAEQVDQEMEFLERLKAKVEAQWGKG